MLHYSLPSVTQLIHLKLVLVSCNAGGATLLSSDIPPWANIASAKQRTWMQQFIVSQAQTKVLVEQTGWSLEIIPPVTEQEWDQ
jgi:hypothetical protein